MYHYLNLVIYISAHGLENGPDAPVVTLPCTLPYSTRLPLPLDNTGVQRLCQSSFGDTTCAAFKFVISAPKTRVLRATTSAAQYLLTDTGSSVAQPGCLQSRQRASDDQNHLAATVRNPTHTMSTAIAMAPSPAPHDRNAYVDIAPSNSSPRETRISAPNASNHNAPRSESTSPRGSSGSKSSPNSLRNAPPPKIIVKKEPASPGLPTSRHRPRKLDLSKNNSSAANSNQKGTAPLTSRETGGLAIQDVGLACLSPGFVTQDPTMREQLQRSISVREQQRHIIESRLQQTARPGDAPIDSAKEMPGPSAFGAPPTASANTARPEPTLEPLEHLTHPPRPRYTDGEPPPSHIRRLRS
ncbi:hypothetical protein V496_10300 [Pseudogymnoascus sp. VKM F-4515 (FW-2607)]|nr:hypothetical protein V496_10300 [Pseudogymnoascus sp. VKM F-4515 (FW-2607)]